MMYYLAAFFEIIAFIVFLIVYKNSRDIVLMYLGLFLLFDIIFDIASFIMFSYFKKPVAWLSNFSLIAELFIIPCIFYKLIPKQNKNKFKKILLVFSSFISFLIIYISLFFLSNSEWNYRSRVIVSVYFVILACYYLYREFVSDDLEEFLVQKAGFWIAVSILVYHTGTSIVIALHHFTIQNNISLEGMPLHHFFSAILAILSNIFLTIAIIVWKKPSVKE